MTRLHPLRWAAFRIVLRVAFTLCPQPERSLALASLPRDVDDMRRRIAERASGGSWLPIASAPRDGSEIILGARGWVDAGFWAEDASECYCAGPGWFCESDRAAMAIAKNVYPTHWQPYPAAP